jgi:ABC-type lipoprotein export system ATPase subunit
MAAIIQAQELRKTYKIGKVDVPALRGVSFDVAEGEFVSVVGPSGSGKSTLFYILGGLTKADGGRVLIGGTDFAQLSDGERTRLRKSKIGFVFQKFNLLPTLSANDNIWIAGYRRTEGNGGGRRALQEDHGVARYRQAPRPSPLGVERRGTAEGRVGARSDQSAGDRAGGRADRQPRY